MHLGLSGPPAEDDWPLVRDLGVSWIKCSADGPGLDPKINQQRKDGLARMVETCQQADLHLVVDLRYSDPLHNGQCYAEALNRLAVEGFGNQELIRRAWLEAMSVMGEWLYETVTTHQAYVQDWEIWGEWTCPIVTQAPYNVHDYTLQLMASHDAIKQADPQARVWTGGGGVNALSGWVKTLVNPARVPPEVCVWAREGVGQHFEVLNWHHYFQTAGRPQELVERLTIEKLVYKYDLAFGEAAKLLGEYGKAQWQASTEWGIPVRPDADFTENHLPMLQSDAYMNGVAPMRESEAADFYEECFQCFDRHKLQVVCVHSLREAQGLELRARQFWGDFCGLLGWDGEKWYKRPHWDVVQKWAWRARESRVPAFAEDHANSG